MMQQTSIPEAVKSMVNQSMVVLSNPSVPTFERYERNGTALHAGIFVGIAALITGLFGLAGGFGGLVASVLSTLIGFFVFTGLVYYIGRQQGGTGTFDEVAYTFSLFWAPLAVIVAVVALLLTITLIGIFLLPLLALAALVANAYFAYLAVQSSMNLVDRTKIFITLGGAVIGTWIIQILLARL